MVSLDKALILLRSIAIWIIFVQELVQVHIRSEIHGLRNQGLNSGVAMVRAVAASLKKCGFNHSFRRGEPCFLPRSYPAERMIWKSIGFSLGWSFSHRFVYWRVTAIEQPNRKRWYTKSCKWCAQATILICPQRTWLAITSVLRHFPEGMPMGDRI